MINLKTFLISILDNQHKMLFIINELSKKSNYELFYPTFISDSEYEDIIDPTFITKTYSQINIKNNQLEIRTKYYCISNDIPCKNLLEKILNRKYESLIFKILLCKYFLNRIIINHKPHGKYKYFFLNCAKIDNNYIIINLSMIDKLEIHNDDDLEKEMENEQLLDFNIF